MGIIPVQASADSMSSEEAWARISQMMRADEEIYGASRCVGNRGLVGR